MASIGRRAKAWKRGVIRTGISVVKICSFEPRSATDTVRPSAAPPQRPGLPGNWSRPAPHYDGEKDRRPTYQRARGAGFPAGYAADDGAALYFVGTDLVARATSRVIAGGYRVPAWSDIIMETRLWAGFSTEGAGCSDHEQEGSAAWCSGRPGFARRKQLLVDTPCLISLTGHEPVEHDRECRCPWATNSMPTPNAASPRGSSAWSAAPVPERNTALLGETVMAISTRADGRGHPNRRIAGSGSLSMRSLRSSMMCCGRLVPGDHVHATAGRARIHFRKNWAQLSQSNSAAHERQRLRRARAGRGRPRRTGRLTRTATPRSRARGRMRRSASRSPSE